MSLLTRTVATIAAARMLAGHPVVQAGLLIAPALLTPQVRSKAKDLALDAAYGAGQVARTVVERTQKMR